MADAEVNRILAAVAGADPDTILVAAKDLEFMPDRNGVPNVHFAPGGCKILSRRMVAAYRKLRMESLTGSPD